MATIQGPPGPAGAQGPRGNAGPQGPLGPQGQKGDQGPSGANGVRGQAGPQGSPGAPGRDGANGAPGRDGSNGRDGANGTNGADGIDGAPATWVAHTTALRALAPPSGPLPQSAVMAGYHAPGDGGGGVFYWDSASTIADNGGWHFAPNGHAGAGRWVRVVENFTFNLRHWGAQDSEDFSIDCYPAFAAIMAYLDAFYTQPDTRAARIIVPSGFYRSKTAWTINRAVQIEGDGKLSTYIKFSPEAGAGNPIDGIVFDRQNWPSTTASAGSSLRGMTLNGDGDTYGFLGPFSGKSPAKPFWNEYDPQTYEPSGHDVVVGSAVRVHTPCIIENVNTQSFALDGFHIESISASLNANVTRILNCDSQGHGRHGFYFAGENANACIIQSPNANNCGGWGVYDRSFLGNTYVAGQIAECAEWTRNVNALIDSMTALGIFAGSNLGGVYATADKGTNWIDFNTGVQNANDPDLDGAGRSSPISCFTIDTDNENLYAGSNKQYTAFQPGGVFKWAGYNTLGGNLTPANTGLTDLDVRALAYDDGVVYAGCHTGGVFKSTDEAGTWAASNSGLGTLDVRALAADRSNHGTVYAGTFGGGVFKSTDHGATWAASNTGLSSTNVLCLYARNSVLYAGCDDGKFYTSTNGGTSWSLLFTQGSGFPIQCLAVDAATPANVYIGTGGAGVYYSSDTGSTWTHSGQMLDSYNLVDNPDVRSLLVVAGAVYAGVEAWSHAYQPINPGGVFRSDDSGATFTQKSVLFCSGGGYWSKESESQNVFVGCYAESDVRNDITLPAVVVGGVLGSAMAANSKSTAALFTSAGMAGANVYGPIINGVTVFQSISATIPYSVGPYDHTVLIDASNFSAQVSLPNPTDFTGRRITFKRVDSSAAWAVVSPNGHSFEGATGGHYLMNQYETLVIESQGNDWKIISWTTPKAPTHPTSSIPDESFGESGQQVFDSTTKQLKVNTGSSWEAVGRDAPYDPGDSSNWEDSEYPPADVDEALDRLAARVAAGPTTATASISMSEVALSGSVTPVFQGGNYTTGTVFQSMRAGVVVKGMRFYWGGSSGTIRCSLWDASGTRLQTIDVAVSGAGIFTATFTGTETLTPFTNYYVSVHDLATTGYYYVTETNASAQTPFASWHFMIAGDGYFRRAGCYNSIGDTWPSTADGVDLYFTEPVFG